MRRHPELTVPERRRFGKSAETRREALRRHRAGEPLTKIGQWLELNNSQVRYLLMQERVEDGEIPAVAPSPAAIAAALRAGGEFGNHAWVACRAGVVQNYVVRNDPRSAT